MKININRMMEDIDTISSIRPEDTEGCTRFSYSQEDYHAREYVMAEMKKSGVLVYVDSVGNIHGILPGKKDDEGRIVIGSHLDTVKNGGPLDGLLGVAAGLEILRVFQEEKIVPKRGIEIIAFAEEEGSNFGSTMLGSKCWTGRYDVGELRKLKNDESISAYQVMKHFGLYPDSLEEQVVRPEEIYSMLELHIEQGQVLESQNIPLGSVQGIFGMVNLQVTIKGTGNHAGATPMNLRKDPLVEAGRIISSLPDWVRALGSDSLVATVGKLQVFPNASNVIPEKVVFTIDVRDKEESSILALQEKIREEGERLEKEENMETIIEVIASSEPVLLSQRIVNIFREESSSLGYPCLPMFSGAVHDCAMMVGITEVGLLFVPSIGGRSHVPEEKTRREDLEVGASVLLHAAYRLSME